LAQVNPLTRELLVKLVYYGPGLGGKTTSLQRIHQASPAETRGQIVSLATPVDRTLYFDFLPLRATIVRDHHVRLQLFTVPGQVYFNATRKLVLTGADGVVFVADSQMERHDANLESLENLAANLEDQGRSLAEMPLVFQYNKRDLPTALSMAELDESLNALGLRSFPTNAATGEGVLDALDELVRTVLADLERRNVFGAAVNATATPRFARAESTLEDQIGRASEEWRASQIPPPRSEDDDDAHEETKTYDDDPLPDVSPPPADGLRPTVHPMGPAWGQRGPSWVRLFPEAADQIIAAELDIAEGRLADAIIRFESLALELLENVAQQAGFADSQKEAVHALPLLGIEGDRWLAFRRLVRRARSQGPLDEKDLLVALGMIVEMRLRRDRLLG
jgi:signal recognition particle receptor subunit beta